MCWSVWQLWSRPCRVSETEKEQEREFYFFDYFPGIFSVISRSTCAITTSTIFILTAAAGESVKESCGAESQVITQ